MEWCWIKTGGCERIAAGSSDAGIERDDGQQEQGERAFHWRGGGFKFKFKKTDGKDRLNGAYFAAGGSAARIRTGPSKPDGRSGDACVKLCMFVFVNCRSGGRKESPMMRLGQRFTTLI